jgi:hypothetical protein
MEHQLLAYADDLTSLGDNIDIINKNTENLINANMQIDLGVNVEKTKYTLVPRHQNADENWDIQIANRLSEMCYSSNIWELQQQITI